MKAQTVMTTQVISVTPGTPVGEIAKSLVENEISAVPVIEDGKLVGIVSEGDLMQRSELGTDTRRRGWFEVLVDDPARLAKDYVHSHGRNARDVMTHPVVTVDPETPVAEIAETLEDRKIKRVPVVEGDTVVGIVSRGNLVRALAARPPEAPKAPLDDEAIRQQLLKVLQSEGWADSTHVNPIVTDGVVHLWGWVDTDAQRRATQIAAEAIPGVQKVENYLRITPHVPYAG